VLGPVEALAGLGAVVFGACVWRWPALAAYLLVGLTPLTVGISSGSSVPVRPNEVLAVVMGGVLVVRGVAMLRTGQWPALRLDRAEAGLVAMAVASSAVPLVWMAARQEQITSGDLLYSLVLWKFLGLYALVRLSVRTEQQVRRCLWISVAAASVVAVLAIMQSLGLFGVPGLLARFFAYSGNAGAGAGGRGSSTLGLPAATGDLLVFNLAVAAGLWARYRRRPLLLAGAAALFVVGTLAAGEFSSAIGLLTGAVCIAVAAGRPKLLALLAPAAVIGGLIMQPVIARRLQGFQSASGLPASWTGRLHNLQTYFWPTLFSHGNFLFGVQPDARVQVATQAAGYVWIESGYTWLLWGGGIPLLASFCYFTWAAARRAWAASRGPADAASAAGTAAFTAAIVIAVLMLLDPHLTYRGSGDEFFFLLALATPQQHPAGPATGTASLTRPLARYGGLDQCRRTRSG